MPLGACHDRAVECIWQGIQGQAERHQLVPLKISMSIRKKEMEDMSHTCHKVHERICCYTNHSRPRDLVDIPLSTPIHSKASTKRTAQRIERRTKSILFWKSAYVRKTRTTTFKIGSQIGLGGYSSWNHTLHYDKSQYVEEARRKERPLATSSWKSKSKSKRRTRETGEKAHTTGR